MKMRYIGKDVSLTSVKMYDVSVDVLPCEDVLLMLGKIALTTEDVRDMEHQLITVTEES